MEPTFNSGDIVLGSMVPREDWTQLRNFYIYVIVTHDALLLKRIFMKSMDEWVLISDNEKNVRSTIDACDQHQGIMGVSAAYRQQSAGAKKI